MADTTTTGRRLHCVVVTPERMLLDEPADFVALPMYDGELGVLPGRAPLIGRLGYGELRIRRDGAVRRFFVDGGFAQVRADTVSVLTPRALKAEEINPAAARQALEEARRPAPPGGPTPSWKPSGAKKPPPPRTRAGAPPPPSPDHPPQRERAPRVPPPRLHPRPLVLPDDVPGRRQRRVHRPPPRPALRRL